MEEKEKKREEKSRSERGLRGRLSVLALKCNIMTRICSTPSSYSHLQALLSSYCQHGFRKCFTISHLHYSENLKLHKTSVMP